MSYILHLDFETYSDLDIKKVGAYKYASDPSTRILIAHVRNATGGDGTWLDPEYLENEASLQEIQSHQRALGLLRLMDKPDTLIYAHNAQFEHVICKYKMEEQMGLRPPERHQWRCTAAMARRAAMPSALGKCAEALGLPQGKDREGMRLIRLFSMPKAKTRRQPHGRIRPIDEPAEYRRFVKYCITDVDVEFEIHQKLQAFEMEGQTLETFQADMLLNDTGIPVNVDSMKKAQKIIEEVNFEYSNHFREITFLNSTQTVKVLKWFKERGYPADDMQAATVAEHSDVSKWTDDKDVKLAFLLRKRLSFISVRKIQTMLMCEVEGKVHGCHLYYGAGTGRWSGKLIQPQNFKRPTFKDTDVAFDMIQGGCTVEDIKLMYGNPLEAISSCIRHFIQPTGGSFFDADYAAIEARIVCWLAGQEDALERFREGVDSYKDMASIIFNKKTENVDSNERWMGKQTVLGCGFQMGADTFLKQCLKASKAFGITGVQLDEDIAQKSVDAFRKKYAKVAKLWSDCDRAARNAIKYKGKKFRVNDKLSFSVVNSQGIDYLVLKMPSGRNIVYPWPALEESKSQKGKYNITFFGQIPFKAAWGRISTYGGKLVENATQGTAADVMACGLINAQKAGFDVVALIHDEALAHNHRYQTLTLDDFIKCLTDMPDWAHGLPIEAEGEEVPYYKK